jgi:hypothetical protein
MLRFFDDIDTRFAYALFGLALWLSGEKDD